MIKKVCLGTIVVLFIFGCKNETEKVKNAEKRRDTNTIDFATGFTILQNDGYKILEVKNPWPNAEKSFSYAMVPKDDLLTFNFPENTFDAVIGLPIERLIVTSTTHIPALEALGALDKLIGFPDTKYISSLPARERIKKGGIRELGQNNKLNSEITIALQPELVVGFAIDNENSSYGILEKANIPVVFNGDWVEQSPLGKAEWIKFFGVLLGKEKQADSIFNSIQKSYTEAKSLAAKAKVIPSVLSGALYKDVWYLPAGNSWAAQFIKDANGDYLYQNTDGTGSLSLGLESVLEGGSMADYWLSPSQFVSYQEMMDSNSHYQQFKAFQNKKVFTFANAKGPTGGLLYYELAPQRPDLVLKDMIKILHPELLPDYSPYFFTPLQ